MKSASDFLSKFHKLTPPNDAVRRAVAQAVSAVLGTHIPKERIRVHNGVAFIELSSVARNKLRIERQSVLEVLYERLPSARHTVRDIR
ncbi:hypothetical protein KGO06_02270 [Patescibacteria group bacterium]|nr:hypothetical protein [Patescibacteria group bacterium]